MAVVTADQGPGAGVPLLGITLKQQLRRSLRARKVRALMLVLPLLAFILITFLMPIGDMLFRSVENQIVPDTLPHTGFQIFRQPDRQVLSVSPFRLGEQPNIRVGVAMITSAPEALALHEKMAKELLHRALKGPAAVAFMREVLARSE